MWNPQGEARRYATDCGDAMGYYQRYPIPVAAALWCGVPPNEVASILEHASDVGRAIVSNPYVRCLEPKCRALHEAIESGELPVYREQGSAVRDHVAPERRHVARTELRDWIAKHYPDQRPPTLFDATERATHSAINADAFRALQADRDAARAELEKAAKWANETLQKQSELQHERDSLAAMVDKMSQPNARAETTYLNIIGGLLSLMLGKSPAGMAQSVFQNQAAIISALLVHHGDKAGIADSTLENKFAEANRSIRAS